MLLYLLSKIYSIFAIHETFLFPRKFFFRMYIMIIFIFCFLTEKFHIFAMIYLHLEYINLWKTDFLAVNLLLFFLWICGIFFLCYFFQNAESAESTRKNLIWTNSARGIMVSLWLFCDLMRMEENSFVFVWIFLWN